MVGLAELLKTASLASDSGLWVEHGPALGCQLVGYLACPFRDLGSDCHREDRGNYCGHRKFSNAKEHHQRTVGGDHSKVSAVVAHLLYEEGRLDRLYSP